MPHFAEVILPLAVKSNFTYRLKAEQLGEAQVGKRVYVQFGRNKIYTGILKQIWETEMDEREAAGFKFVEEIIDESPIVFQAQFDLFEWLSFYYMCTEGEVLKAALPIGLKPQSNVYVSLAEADAAWESWETDDKEYLLLEALSTQAEIGSSEVAEIWSVQNPLLRLKKMEEKGWIRIFQKVETTYQPKTKSYLFLTPLLANDQVALQKALDALEKIPKQENLLLQIVSAHLKGEACPKTELLKALNYSSAVLKSLIEKGFVEEQYLSIDRLPDLPGQQQQSLSLNAAQLPVFQTIRQHFAANPKQPMLLYGITGSGKTLVYIQLIKELIAQGKQVLYLLPEIAITQQIVERVRREIGQRVGVYHSRFNNNERVEIWQKVASKQYDLVIGVRSAIFLPFENLGMIVVDEEHDRSFKQESPAPRYHARDVAVWMAHKFGCNVLMGSATPAFETFHNVEAGKYGMVELKTRATNARLPSLEIVDMRRERTEKTSKGVFSSVLIAAMKSALFKGEQVILFQNRRGYSPYVLCSSCGHVPHCINCDISLTFHKQKEYVRCHYCGHTEYLNERCPSCGNFTLKKQGIGTEKIEEEVKALFPQASVERMDLDTTRGKTQFQRLITRFEAKEIDVLVGTQMVSKGLDFENVTLVGVINADNLLSYPDFRVQEQAYQMLTQVSGRAGRSSKHGRVVIQTFQPEHQVLSMLDGDYDRFYELIVHQRAELHYPPFTRLINLTIQHPEQTYIEAEALRLNTFLKPIFGDALLGPDYMLVPRVRNFYRMQFVLKLDKKASMQKVRDAITQSIERYYHVAPNKTLRIMVDVDPL